MVTHKNYNDLDTPEIRIELIRGGEGKINEDLSDFNKKLNKELEFNPKEHKGQPQRSVIHLYKHIIYYVFLIKIKIASFDI